MACPARNARQVCPDRVGTGSMPASLSIRHTVDGAILYPRPVSSPWMRWLSRPGCAGYAEFGITLVPPSRCSRWPSRSISAVSSALAGGRPVRCVQVHFRVTRRRCHRRMLPGVTSRCIRRLLGKSRISAVKTTGRPSSARAGDGCGAARRPRAAAPEAPRSWRPLSDRAGQASRRTGPRSGRAGEGETADHHAPPVPLRSSPQLAGQADFWHPATSSAHRESSRHTEALH